ncbi:DUF2779 domain-containing protein, partial [bacterium]|nr:DUF2779 domain-containing protein [bacterium]
PFQFSCHILDKDGNLTHPEFLHDDETDPREPLLKALMEAIGSSGSIIAYNAGFEKRILNDLARWFPQYKELLFQWTLRFWDQLVIFRKYYSDYHFKGSNSIKSVLPVIVPSMSYSGLAVPDGTAAQITWNEMIRLPDGPEKQTLYNNLLQYCGQDTLAMVKIHELLQASQRK